MRLKYVIHIPTDANCQIAMRYSYELEELVIGGFTRNADVMQDILSYYFIKDKKDGHKIIRVSANKIKYKCHLSGSVFRAGIQEMREHGLIIESVISHERLMR